MADKKRYDVKTESGETVLADISADNAYLTAYGKIVRNGAAVADLLVDEFTFKEFALSGQKPTVYVIVRTA